MPRIHNRLFTILLALGMIAGTSAIAEDIAAEPTTTSNPHISVTELDIIAAPMTVGELKIEADGWKKLLKEAAEDVAEAKLRILPRRGQTKIG